MDFRLLGALEVSADGVAADLGQPKQRALLAILLLHAGEIVPIDRLIDLLWGDSPPRTANHSIQIYVSELRKTFESLGAKGILSTRAPGYQLDADPASIDIHRFEEQARQGTRKLRAGDPEGGAEELRAALRLWRGPALSDFTYDEFAQPYIRRFHDLHLDAIEELAAAELAAGRAGAVVPLLDAAIREDPLRERSRELLMLALYRTGRHPEALRTYQQLRTVLDEELGLEPSPPLQRLQERILLHDPSLMPVADASAAVAAAARNPYKGLRSFGERDAADFFGREELVERLLESLRDGRSLIALVGPSGSGKSSAVAAGLIPRLREGAIEGSEHWVIARMVPGANPMVEVEAAIAASAGVPHGLAGLLDPGAARYRRATALRTMPEGARLLLVIDQFEELFTLTDDQQRQRFLSAIARSVTEPGSEVTVLLALRADYYDRPLHHAEFARVFTPGVINVLPMAANELEEAVVGPSERAGVSVEPALLADLVADAAHRPGTLPLLEFALTELFDQRADASLTLDGYRALGGIRGVLSRSAEVLYNALSPEERHVAMQVFLRLVQLGHGTAESRRRLPLADLTGLDLDPVALSRVLDTFGQRRLLSFDRDAATDQATVEVAHESLFREWDRLAGWIDQHRTALRRYESFMAAADEWEANARHPDYLLTGTRLSEFEAWSQEGTLQITGRQREFLGAGVARREMEQAAARSQAETQRRLERRAKWRLVALAAVIAVSVGGLGLAAWAGVFADVKHVALVHEGTGEYDLLSEAGFDRAVSEFGLLGEEFLFEERVANADAKVRELLELTAAGPELVIIGSGSWPVEEIARARPNVLWVARDQIDDLSNVAYPDFLDHEGAYLAGVAAALASRTGTIGFIGGYDAWFIWTFHGGYVAGARSVNPEIEVLSAYLSSGADFSGFQNAGAAEAEARQMYGAGSDVVFHASGNSGVGVFEAATALSTPDRQLWAIGVDNDQYENVLHLPGAVHPDAWRRHILTSVLKRVDLANYVVLADFARGRFTPGGRTFDLASGVFDISYSGGYIEDLRPQIEAAKAAIVADEVLVPCVPTEREAQAAEVGWVSTEVSCSR